MSILRKKLSKIKCDISVKIEQKRIKSKLKKKESIIGSNTFITNDSIFEGKN